FPGLTGGALAGAGAGTPWAVHHGGSRAGGGVGRAPRRLPSGRRREYRRLRRHARPGPSRPSPDSVADAKPTRGCGRVYARGMGGPVALVEKA
ncbi:hypothetical protein, partial [Streptomyces sp. NPDC004285]